MPIRDFILLSFFLGSLPICFLRPFYGIILWVIVAFLNPQSFIWSYGASFPWAQAIAIPTLLGFALFECNSRGLRAREVKLILALWAWFVFTSIFSISTPALKHHSADTIYRLTFVSKILLMTVVMVPIVSTFRRLRLLIIVVVGSFGFFVAKAFPFVLLSGGAFRVYGPERSMVSDNNDLGLALNMTLPLYFFLAQSETKSWMKILFASLFVMSIPVIFFTWSRGALVGLIAVFCSLLVSSSMKQRLVLVPVIAVGVMVAIMFAPASWRHRMDPTRSDAVDRSAQGRLDVWAYCINLASDYPITGGGFATFTPELFQQYGLPNQQALAPHSLYFQLLAEHGYVGLGLYLTMILSFFATAQRLVRQARIRGDEIVRQYAKMLQFSVIGFMTSGLFLGRAYFDYLFFIVACLIILKRLAEDEWSFEDSGLMEPLQDEELPAPDSVHMMFEGGT